MALQKREKKMLVALAITAVLGGFIMWRNSRPEPAPEPSKTEKKEEKKEVAPKTSTRSSGGSRSSRGGSGGGSSPSSSGKTVSFIEFSAHVSPESCWVVLDKAVYNVSEYLRQAHVRDLKLAQYCGTVGFEDGYVQGSYELQEEIKTYSTYIGDL